MADFTFSKSGCYVTFQKNAERGTWYGVQTSIFNEIAPNGFAIKFELQEFILGYRDLRSHSCFPECRTERDLIQFCEGLNKILQGKVKVPSWVLNPIPASSAKGSISTPIAPILINVPKI